jgi:SAM-dependent methyltransferase
LLGKIIIVFYNSKGAWRDSIKKNRAMYQSIHDTSHAHTEATKLYWTKILKLCKIATKNKIICDVGCSYSGIGIVIKDAKELVGIEPEKSFFKQFGFSKNYTKIINSKIEELDGYEHHFDIVFASQIFDHVEDPFKTAEKLKAITKPGGLIVLEEKTYENWFFKAYYSMFHNFIDPLHMRRNSCKDLESFFGISAKIIPHNLGIIRDIKGFDNRKRSKVRSAFKIYVWLNIFAILMGKLFGKKISNRFVLIFSNK